jgi:hypothetical protein
MAVKYPAPVCGRCGLAIVARRWPYVTMVTLGHLAGEPVRHQQSGGVKHWKLSRAQN